LLVSELVACTGVPLATVKYYLREGLLMPGRATSATRALYDEAHVRRLGLIKALSGLGLPISRMKVIVGLIDNPGPSLFAALGAAVAALSPVEHERHGEDSHDWERSRSLPRSAFVRGSDQSSPPDAAAVLRLLGWSGPADSPAVGQLDRALAAAAAAGVPMDADRLAAYAVHTRAIAAVDIELMPRESASAAIEYAVLGTALYEPIIAALRRIAHAELAANLLKTDRKAIDVP
jgi:DNA-binding transcriptional MerR regulator